MNIHDHTIGHEDSLELVVNRHINAISLKARTSIVEMAHASVETMVAKDPTISKAAATTALIFGAEVASMSSMLESAAGALEHTDGGMDACMMLAVMLEEHIIPAIDRLAEAVRARQAREEAK